MDIEQPSLYCACFVESCQTSPIKREKQNFGIVTRLFVSYLFDCSYKIYCFTITKQIKFQKSGWSHLGEIESKPKLSVHFWEYKCMKLDQTLAKVDIAKIAIFNKNAYCRMKTFAK